MEATGFLSPSPQAEFGPEWVPNPIIARVRAGTCAWPRYRLAEEDE